MVTDLVYLLMGVMLMAMVLAAALAQLRISQSREEEEPVEEEKIYVDLGFEAKPETPIIEEENDSSSEPQETFYDIETETPEPKPVEETVDIETTPMFEVDYEPSGPVVIETPKVIMEVEAVPEPKQIYVEPEPVEEPTPMFEAAYEPSEPVIIETPVIDDPEPEQESIFNVEYEESEPVVIETTKMFIDEEQEVEETPEPEETETAPILIEEPPVEVPEEPPVEPVIEDPVPEETPEPEEVVVEKPKRKRRRRERKPVIDENDPDTKIDMGVKTCVNCGSEVPDTRYCIYCGKPIDEKTE